MRVNTIKYFKINVIFIYFKYSCIACIYVNNDSTSDRTVYYECKISSF